MTKRETRAKGCGKATTTGHGEYLLCGSYGYGEIYYCADCLRTVLRGERQVGLMLVEDGVLVCVWGKRFLVKTDQLVDLISWSGMDPEDDPEEEPKP